MKRHWKPMIGVGITTALIASLSLVGLSAAPASAEPVVFVPAVTSSTYSTVVASPASVEADGVATSTVTVTVKDTTDAPVVGDVVTLVPTTGNAVVTGTTTGDTSTTNGSGVATFTGKDTTAQSSTFTATDGATLDKASNLVTFTTPIVSNSESTIAATTPVEADGVATSTVTVTVKDDNSVPINGDVVTLAANSGTSHIIGVTTADTSTTDSSGVATFTVSDTTVQSPTYTATDGGALTGITSNAVVFFRQVADNANSQITVTTPVVADGVDTSTVTVHVEDNNSVPIDGDLLTLAANSGSSVIVGTTAGATSTTDSMGAATFTVTDTAVESPTYTATDSGPLTVTSSPVDFTTPLADNSDGDSFASALADTVAANGTAYTTIQVYVADYNDVPIDGDVVTLSANSGSSVITGTTTADTSTTDSSGYADFTVTDTTVQSGISYTATDTSLNLDVVSGSVNFIPAADNTLSTIVVSPTSVVADGDATTQVTVTVKDSNGVTINNEYVGLEPTTINTTAAVTGDAFGPVSETNDAGQATFTVADTAAETLQFHAYDEGSLDVVSAAVTFTTPTADNTLSTAVASPTAVVASGAATSTVTVQVEDSNGEAITGDVVTLAANSGNSVIVGTNTADTSVTDGNGDATFTVTDTTAQSGLTYHATGGTLDVTSNPVTFTPAADNNPTFSGAVAGPTLVEADGVATTTVTVTAKDSRGVTISGDLVTLTPLSGGAVITGTTANNTSTTSGTGVATFTVTDTSVEDVAFVATDSGTLSVLSNPVAFTPPQADNPHSTITATGPVIADGVATSTVTVTVKDDNSVPVVAPPVTLTSSSGTVRITARGVTSSGGVTSFGVSDTVAERGVTFTATDGGTLGITSNAVTFTPTADNLLSTAVAGPSSVVANGVAAATVTVTVKDPSGLAMSGQTVALTADSVHPVISGSGITNSLGVARFTVTDTTAQKAIRFTAVDIEHLDVISGAVAFTPTTILQTGARSSTILTTASAGFTSQLGATGNFGAVAFHKTAGSPRLSVSATGKIRTSGALPEQIYSLSGTTTSANGDVGKFAFTLTVKLPPVTGPTVSIKDHTSTTIIGKDAAAKVGTHVTVEVFKNGKVVTSTLRLVDGNRRMTYKTGALDTGRYRVVFIIAGKVVKTTIVIVG